MHMLAWPRKYSNIYDANAHLNGGSFAPSCVSADDKKMKTKCLSYWLAFSMLGYSYRAYVVKEIRTCSHNVAIFPSKLRLCSVSRS